MFPWRHTALIGSRELLFTGTTQADPLLVPTELRLSETAQRTAFIRDSTDNCFYQRQHRELLLSETAQRTAFIRDSTENYFYQRQHRELLLSETSQGGPVSAPRTGCFSHIVSETAQAGLLSHVYVFFSLCAWLTPAL